MTTCTDHTAGSRARRRGVPHRHRERSVLAVASIASFLVALDLLVVTTALDAMRRDLGVDAGALQWTVTAYGVSFASLLMAGAALGDRYGRRLFLVVGLGTFVTGSVFAALSTGVWGLVVSRVVQGAGAAIVVPVSLTIVATTFSEGRRGAAIGALEGITGLAVIAGPIVGGAVSQYLSWQWIFWINVPVGVLAIPCVFAVIDETRGENAPVDVRGVVLMAAAACGFVWVLSRGNDVGWTSGEIATALGATLVIAVAFIGWQRRVRHPVLRLSFFRSRQFCAGAAAAMLMSAALYGSVFFMAQLLQASLGYASFDAGLRLLPWTASLLVVAPLAGRAGDRYGPRPVLLGGLALTAASFAWLAGLLGPDSTYGSIVAPMVLAGIGFSAALPVAQAAIIDSVADSDVGKAAGTTNVLQEIGGALGVAVAVAAFLAGGGYGTTAHGTSGFARAVLACATMAAVGAIAAGALPRWQTRPRTTAGDEFAE